MNVGRIRLCFGLSVLMLGSAAAGQAPPPLEVETVNGSEREEAAKVQLQRLVATYDLDPWTFTRRVRIEAGVIPHSHPVLTLNERYIDQDVEQLTTYIHEQFHWMVLERQSALATVTAAFREAFPEVPAGGSEGARDERSTYLHLVVCDLEFQGLSRLVGKEQAREVLSAQRHYTWIYDRVLTDPRIRRINEEHGMVVP